MTPSARISVGKKNLLPVWDSYWGLRETVDPEGHYHVYAAVWKHGGKLLWETELNPG